MSLILDALKKSEQQRQREKTPNLQSIHQPVVVAAKKSVQPWWWLVAFIIACNFAFFGYWFWREQNADATVARTAALAEPAATQSAEKAENPAQSMPDQDAGSQQTPAEFTRISPREAPAQSAAPDAAQRIEEINELPDSVRNNLPAMTFSFHVYSETPEQRTIIINDRRVREGDEVSAGLRLQSITPDGVILLFEQHRIHIGVLTDW